MADGVEDLNVAVTQFKESLSSAEKKLKQEFRDYFLTCGEALSLLTALSDRNSAYSRFESEVVVEAVDANMVQTRRSKDEE